jgi:ABC-type nitrate/sulfonate/bicarbonate transport system ATPase subunit
MDIRFPSASRIIIAGPSGCGKTTLLTKMIVGNCFQNKFDKIIYCSGLMCNVKLLGIKDIVYVKGFPSQDIEKNILFKNSKNGLLILDDLMEECGRCPTLANLFTKVIIILTKNFDIK